MTERIDIARATIGSLACCLLMLLASPGRAERRVLHAPLAHLRSGNAREWMSFPAEADADKLEVRFQSDANETPWTLGLRRVDVKEGWHATLNGKRLGRLFSDENDMEEVWEIPPGGIQQGENLFVVEPSGSRVDDVRIGEVWLDDRPRSVAFSEAQLQLKAVDDTGKPIPCRFTILDARGSLAALGAESNKRLAVRSGVVYTIDGKADVGIAPGKYTIICGRGFEYNLDKRNVQVEPEEKTSLAFKIRPVVDTSGLAACDTHVHTFEISRHGDASLAERMITLAGEGIDVAIATDHNVHVDYRPHLKQLGADKHVTSIVGNEVTTKFGHFNVFPATAQAPPSNHRAPGWPQLFESIYTTPNVKVAIINHPRDVHSGFTPFAPMNMIQATAKRLDNRELKANAMELINSAALQSDPMPSFHNWLALLNRGHRITAVGSSDSHEVSRKIVGQGRSYVRVDDAAPGAIDADAVVRRFQAGQVQVSLGLLAEITVNGDAHSGDEVDIQRNAKESIEVAVRVLGPDWTKADRVELYMNGQRVREYDVPSDLQAVAGQKVRVRWRIPRPKHDVHFAAVARGPGVTGLHWPIAKPYQPSSNVWRPYVFASTGAVRVDVDGGGFQSAKGYADQLVTRAKSLNQLAGELQAFDRAVATFAAEAWLDAGNSIDNPAAQTTLKSAGGSVKQAFDDYVASVRQSLRAAAELR